MKTSEIDYRDGAMTCRGFLAHDETLKGPRPGVLVVHEAWGLGEHARAFAKKLAGLGYVALAADMFGDGMQVTELPKALAIIGDLLGNPPKLLARAGAALDALRAQSGVDAKKLGAAGFCFGGSTVLQMARSGVALDGVVSFHGALTTKAPATAGSVKAAVLVCTGADDPMIPPEQVTAFEDEMRAAKADWQVIRYGNTVHSFTNEAADGSIAPAILYDKSADRRSFTAMRSFFEERFAG